MLAFGLNLLLFLAYEFSRTVFAGSALASTISDEASLVTHLSNFVRGLVTAKDVFYYIVVTAIALFATARVLESRRWR
jgi:hypothetical protein